MQSREVPATTWPRTPEPVGSSFKPYVLATAVRQNMDVQTSILNGYSPIWIPPDWTPTDRAMLSSPKKPAKYLRLAAISTKRRREQPAATGVADATAISSDPAYMDLAHQVGMQIPSSAWPRAWASAITRSTPTAAMTTPG